MSDDVTYVKLRFETELFKRINHYRHAKQIDTRTAAIAELLKRALDDWERRRKM